MRCTRGLPTRGEPMQRKPSSSRRAFTTALVIAVVNATFVGAYPSSQASPAPTDLLYASGSSVSLTFGDASGSGLYSGSGSATGSGAGTITVTDPGGGGGTGSNTDGGPITVTVDERVAFDLVQID